jgi:hypothetical protein
VSDLLTDARREGERFRNLPPVESGEERTSEDAWSEVAAEMRSALDKHGPRYMGNLTDRALMLAVLTEEVGEVARHVCDGTDWHDEMVQVAAMAMAALHADTHPERAYATSLERKPWDDCATLALHDLGTLKVDANDAVLLRECIAAITAHIESLEAERDWLARWCALYATAPGKSATMTLNECGEQQVAAWLAAAASARVKGRAK